MAAAIPTHVEFDMDLDGTKTYVAVVNFADRVFITVSQLKTLGTLIAASGTRNPDGSVEYSMRTLLGKRESQEDAEGSGSVHALSLCARRLIDRVYNATGKMLLLGIGLKPQNETLDTVKSVLAVLEALSPWARASSSSSGGSSSGAGAAAAAPTGAGVSATASGLLAPRTFT